MKDIFKEIAKFRMKNRYDITNMLKTDAQYMMLLGQRSNGKSFQVKLTVLLDAYYNGTCHVYLRRRRDDLSQANVTDYYADMPISKITNGEYDEVKAYNGSILFVKRDENGEIENKMVIGRYCALNIYERYKSQVFKNYGYVVYEEFITDNVYINDEPRLLQQFVSTVARDSEIKVMLVGNTLTRVCPYFAEWCLEGVLKQKQGTIELYHYHTERGDVNLAVEYCANVNNENKMFFGQSAKQIISGEWDVKEVPKLPRKEFEYDLAYEILLEYQAFKFVLRLLVEPQFGGKILYVYPHTTNREIHRILSDKFSDLPNITSRLDVEKKTEKAIIDCIRLNKICYSDNLTGSDFNKVLKEMIIW